MNKKQRNELASMTVHELLYLAKMDNDPCQKCSESEPSVCSNCTDNNPYLQTADGVELYPSHARQILQESFDALKRQKFIRQ